MAGSRKGERRGGAKPGHINKTASRPPKPRGRPRGSFKREAADPVEAEILNRHVTVAERERQLETYFLIVGKRGRMPKEVLLDAMRYFDETAVDYTQVLAENMRRAAGARNAQEREIFENAVVAAESKVREYVIMAADVAFKAAPFCHPRLSAMIDPAMAKRPGDILSILLEDLDEAGRPARYIDHDPNEVAK